MRKTSLSVAFASIALLVSSPAFSDVFSSQGFSGQSTTLNNLPGVNLDTVPGFSKNENCVESQFNAPSWRDGPRSGTRTDCRVGSFTFSTERSGEVPNPNDLRYGGNPPPWEQRWRPN